MRNVGDKHVAIIHSRSYRAVQEETSTFFGLKKTLDRKKIQINDRYKDAMPWYIWQFDSKC